MRTGASGTFPASYIQFGDAAAQAVDKLAQETAAAVQMTISGIGIGDGMDL